MLKSFYNRLTAIAVAMTPLLLSACDSSNNNNSGPTNFEIMLIPPLLYTASLAHSWLRRRLGEHRPLNATPA